MIDLLLRFLVGGSVVSLFATLGDVLRPKSFAGLFAAAPSVALATVALTIHQKGRGYAAHEAAFMLCGTAAFLVYAWLASRILRRHIFGATVTSILLMPVWFGVAFGLWLALSGRF